MCHPSVQPHEQCFQAHCTSPSCIGVLLASADGRAQRRVGAPRQGAHNRRIHVGEYLPQRRACTSLRSWQCYMFVALSQELPAWVYGLAMQRVLLNNQQSVVSELHAKCRLRMTTTHYSENDVVKRPLFRAIAVSAVIRYVTPGLLDVTLMNCA